MSVSVFGARRLLRASLSQPSISVRALRVLFTTFLVVLTLLDASTARAEGTVPALFVTCRGTGWQLGQYVETAACTEAAACVKAGGSGNIHVGGSGGHYCLSAANDYIIGGVAYGGKGPATCPANSTFQVDGLTRSIASCLCAPGYLPDNGQCISPEPILIELIGAHSTKALPAGPALPMVARVTKGGVPFTGGGEIDVWLNGNIYSAQYPDANAELRFNYVPPLQVTAVDTLTARCERCSNTATHVITVSRCDVCDGVGNPIRPATGEKVQAETDWSDASAHPLTFTRYYGSQRQYADGLGTRWSHNHAASVRLFALEATVALGSGTHVLFKRPSVASPWVADNQIDRLEANATGVVFTRSTDETRWQFGADGRLVSMMVRNGWTYQYTYDANGQLVRVTNAFGRALTFTYSGGRMATLSTPDGQTLRYAYGTNGELAAATAADGATRRYLYENTGFPTALTGVIDESGVRFATFGYDGQGRASFSQHAGAAGNYTVQYPQPRGADITRGSIDPAIYQTSATISDPAGGTQLRIWKGGDGEITLVGASSPAGGINFASRTTQGPLPLSETDFTGVQTTKQWDVARQLPIATTEAANTQVARTTQTTWHPTFRLPVLVNEAGRTTSYTYDALGNKLTETVTDTATSQSRTWQWTYGSNNLPTAITDPKGGVWQFGYDAAGNRTSVRDPLGRVTRYTYDGAGRVLTQTDPNGLVTAYGYDLAGRLVTQSRGGETATFGYTPTGLLGSATLPNGYQVTYSYDAAQRLVGAADNRGSVIAFTLDASGNRVREEVRDANGNIALATTRVINNLNQLAQIQGAAGQTTQLAYDANGEQVASTDPLNQTTRQTLDALRRTTATTFADNASASQAWTALDQLTQVTDPKGVATTYTYNAFGEVMSETSPDIGTITYTRDAVGAVTSTTDAKGQITRIERDALGRPTGIQYAAVGAVSYTYDAAGHVAQFQDRSGTTTYTRDAQGRILTKTQTVNDNPSNPSRYTVTYSYTNGDLTGMTYPSGLRVTYRRTAGRVTGIDVLEPGKNKTTVAFVSNLTYTPLGQPKSWNWSNGDSASRTFDADGRMTSNEFARYGYDVAGRITSITQDLWASRTVVTGTTTTTELYKTPISWTATYDNRNRLTGFARAGASSTFTYDANSNRLTAVETQGSDVDLEGTFDQPNLAQTASQALRIEPTSNRLLGFTQTLTRTQNGQTLATTNSTVNYSVDANGAMTSDGLRTFVYDETDRLSKVEIIRNGEAASVRYLHNALGQRVFKSEPEVEQTLPNEETLGNSFVNWLRQNFGWIFQRGAKVSLGQGFIYGDGEIPRWVVIGEFDNGTATSKGNVEYIWLPIETDDAVLIGVYKAGKLYSTHTDHLGTPRLVVDAANKSVWQWPYSGFGSNNPSGPLTSSTWNGQSILRGTKPSFDLDLRYPGQMADVETGLAYNYLRSYQPTVGRYTQADPIKLGGGYNRFSYANADTLAEVDPTGELALAGAILGGLGNLGYQLYTNNGNWRCVNPWQVGEWAMLGSGAGLVGRAGLGGIARFFNDPRKFREISRAYWSPRGGAGRSSLDHWGITQATAKQYGVPSSLYNAGINLLEMPQTLNSFMGGFVPPGMKKTPAMAAAMTAARIVTTGTVLGAAGLGGLGGYLTGTLAEDESCRCP